MNTYFNFVEKNEEEEQRQAQSAHVSREQRWETNEVTSEQAYEVDA
jgi:hypothetical protein